MDEGFFDLAKNLKGGIMLAGVVRKDRLGGFADVLFAKVGADFSAGPINVDTTMDLVIGKFGLDYLAGIYPLHDFRGRNGNASQVSVYPYIGGRVTYMDLKLGPSGLPSLSGDESWADPSVLRDENHMVFTIPPRMRQTSIISHLGSPSCFWLATKGRTTAGTVKPMRVPRPSRRFTCLSYESDLAERRGFMENGSAVIAGVLLTGGGAMKIKRGKGVGMQRKAKQENPRLSSATEGPPS